MERMRRVDAAVRGFGSLLHVLWNSPDNRLRRSTGYEFQRKHTSFSNL